MRNTCQGDNQRETPTELHEFLPEIGGPSVPDQVGKQSCAHRNRENAKRRRALDGTLNMNEPLQDWALRKVPLEDGFGVGEGFGRVDVLPVPVANIKAFQFPLMASWRMPSDKRAIAVFFCGFESLKQSRAAQKHSGVQRVVVEKIFADVNDVIPFAA